MFMIFSRNKRILIPIFILLFLLGTGILVYTFFKVEDRVEKIATPHAGEIVIQGTMLCLPHKDTESPQTLECALGILTDEGEYYALDFGLSSQTTPELKSGDKISLSGIFTPIERLSTDYWRKYPIKGIISVTDSVVKL